MASVDWRSQSSGGRLVAAVAAVALSGSALVVLQLRPKVAPPSPVAVSLLLSVASAPVKTPVREPTPERGSRLARQPSTVGTPVRKPAGGSLSRSSEPAGSAIADRTRPAESPPEPASAAPLQLSEAVLHRAIRSSSNPAAALDSSHLASVNSPNSTSEALAQRIDQARKSDCLAPNPTGSLLSIPAIVLGALQSKCN